nr:CBS domain-containing protein CBSCBSPB3 isoform X2 [Tanacetum cinerariifolium]
YDDDEGDRVLLTTDSDLVGAVNHARSAGQKVLRLHLDNSEFGQRKRESQLGTVMEERTIENPTSGHMQTGILASAAVIAGIAFPQLANRDDKEILTRWGPDPQTQFDSGILELTGDGCGESPNYESRDGAAMR